MCITLPGPAWAWLRVLGDAAPRPAGILCKRAASSYGLLAPSGAPLPTVAGLGPAQGLMVTPKSFFPPTPGGTGRPEAQEGVSQLSFPWCWDTQEAARAQNLARITQWVLRRSPSRLPGTSLVFKV